MKTKIVEHIAGNALHAVRQAQGEAANMLNSYPQLKNTTDSGIGLDFAVLREKMEEAAKLLGLLT